MISEILKKTVTQVNELFSQPLGDRSKYVGSSDINVCERKAVMSKISPVKLTIQKAMIFARGHIAEDIIAHALDTEGFDYEKQYEARHPDNSDFFAHIDFLIDMPEGGHIVEVKTVSDIPETPHESWVLQTAWQLGLLHSNGMKGVTASIIAINLNSGEFKEYGNYTYSETLFGELLQRADSILACVRHEKEPACEPSLLCGTCEYKPDCPYASFDVISLPDDVTDELFRYKELSDSVKSAKAEADIIKDKLLSVLPDGFKGCVEGLNVKVVTVKDSVIAEKAATFRKGYRKLEIM